MRELGSLSEEDRTLVEDYVLGELSPETATAVERRLRTDTVLRQEFCALQASLRLLTQATPVVEPPPGLRDRIMATHTLRNKILTPATPGSTQPVAPPSRPLRGPRIPWGELIAGGAALLALLLGLEVLVAADIVKKVAVEPEPSYSLGAGSGL
ncbi:MAG: hypothetical protein HC929_01370, partial [Leptolyngbyaceae cyanobacterium SM2_5_2]|nr:hypothetical protein [Leptolyngbyaceae cyanobacterium SM2_5_2]